MNWQANRRAFLVFLLIAARLFEAFHVKTPIIHRYANSMGRRLTVSRLQAIIDLKLTQPKEQSRPESVSETRDTPKKWIPSYNHSISENEERSILDSIVSLSTSTAAANRKEAAVDLLRRYHSLQKKTLNKYITFLNEFIRVPKVWKELPQSDKKQLFQTIETLSNDNSLQLKSFDKFLTTMSHFKIRWDDLSLDAQKNIFRRLEYLVTLPGPHNLETTDLIYNFGRLGVNIPAQSSLLGKGYLEKSVKFLRSLRLRDGAKQVDSVRRLPSSFPLALIDCLFSFDRFGTSSLAWGRQALASEIYRQRTRSCCCRWRRRAGPATLPCRRCCCSQGNQTTETQSSPFFLRMHSDSLGHLGFSWVELPRSLQEMILRNLLFVPTLAPLSRGNSGGNELDLGGFLTLLFALRDLDYDITQEKPFMRMLTKFVRVCVLSKRQDHQHQKKEEEGNVLEESSSLSANMTTTSSSLSISSSLPQPEQLAESVAQLLLVLGKLGFSWIKPSAKLSGSLQSMLIKAVVQFSPYFDGYSWVVVFNGYLPPALCVTLILSYLSPLDLFL